MILENNEDMQEIILKDSFKFVPISKIFNQQDFYNPLFSYNYAGMPEWSNGSGLGELFLERKPQKRTKRKLRNLMA